MKRACLFAALFCLAFSVIVFADETGQSDVELLVVDTQELIINEELIDIPTPGVDQFNASYTETATASLTVKSNVPWKLSMKTKDWSWPEGVEKAVSHYEWKLEGQGDFQSCSNSNVTDVISGGPTGGTVVTLNYRVKLDWANDVPGAYSIVQEYTLTKDS